MKNFWWIVEFCFYGFWSMTFLTFILLFIPSSMNILDIYLSPYTIVIFLVSLPKYFIKN